MPSASLRTLAVGVTLLGALGPVRSLRAQVGVGVWVREVPASKLALTMTVEACCHGGRRLSYHFDMGGTTTIMLIESPFDGSEQPVLINGKPSGETMAITRVDDHHVSTVVKMNGKPFGTSKATLSANGKVLTVLNEFSASVGGNQAGTSTERWVRR